MFNRVNEIYEFGPFRLNVGERIVERIDGLNLPPLPEKSFLILVLLVRNSGLLITKDEFINSIWQDTAVEENNLEKSIHTIRQVLGDSPREARFIETVRKHGYRFVAPVRRCPVEEPNLGPDEAAAVTEPEALPGAPREPSPIGGAALRLPYEPVGTRDRSARAPGIVALVLLAALVFVVGSFLTGPVPNVGSEVSRAERARGTHGRSPAYDLYVRGKVKVGAENLADTEAAIRTLEEAVAVDPDFAPAYAQLARAYNTRAFKYSTGAERKLFHENAAVAIEKALALDPNLAEGHFARGLILWTHTEGFPHEQAIRSYKRALAIDPGNDETYHQLSLVYSHIGLIEEAAREVERALELNPKNTLARYRSGVYKQYQGRFEEALSIHETIPRDSTPMLVDRSMAEILIQLGRTEEAERIVEDNLGRSPQDEAGSFTSVKALLFAKAGRAREAEAAIRRAQEIGSGYGHFHHSAYNFACAYSILGQPEEAVRWLESAAGNGFPNYSYFLVDPNLEGIRNNPKFVALMSVLKERRDRYRALP